ncbi:hypothetical protein BGX38DRAFT_1198685 [Terfezia claveryi]|nr:hypothetical protein BGX38DRAFT_1198685 [Terfezia claveryi]
MRKPLWSLLQALIVSARCVSPRCIPSAQYNRHMCLNTVSGAVLCLYFESLFPNETLPTSTRCRSRPVRMRPKLNYSGIWKLMKWDPSEPRSSHGNQVNFIPKAATATPVVVEYTAGQRDQAVAMPSIKHRVLDRTYC